MSGNSGAVMLDNMHIVYGGDLSSPADMNSTCRKMTHRNDWERFHCNCICRILENLEMTVLFVFWKFRFIIEKCDGVLVIENKKKKVMIDELKKKGYDPDPVKAWKIRQNRDEALVSVCSFLLDSGQNV